MTDMYARASTPGDRNDDPTVMSGVFRRTSWGAIIAGTVIAISAQMVFSVLGIAIGLTSVDPYGSGSGLTTAAAAWWLISGTIALLIGGMVVGRFAGMTRNYDVMLHGLTMWAVTAVFGFVVVTSGAGAVYGTTMSATYAVRGSDAYSNTYARDAGVNTRTAADDTAITATDPNEMTAGEYQENAQTASWWTLIGLAVGIGASLLGTWMAAPKRILMIPASEQP